MPSLLAIVNNRLQWQTRPISSLLQSPDLPSHPFHEGEVVLGVTVCHIDTALVEDDSGAFEVEAPLRYGGVKALHSWVLRKTSAESGVSCCSSGRRKGGVMASAEGCYVQYARRDSNPRPPT